MRCVQWEILALLTLGRSAVAPGVPGSRSLLSLSGAHDSAPSATRVFGPHSAQERT